jgi:hypothetical protein
MSQAKTNLLQGTLDLLILSGSCAMPSWSWRWDWPSYFSAAPDS